MDIDAIRRYKLTPTQIAVLKRLAGWDKIHVVDGFDAYAYWSKTLTKIRWSTLHKLSDNGLIIRKHNDGYHLTDLGRSVVELDHFSTQITAPTDAKCV